MNLGLLGTEAEKLRVQQNDLRIRAAFKLSISREDGQKASRCTLCLLAADTLMRARDLAADWPGRDGPGVVLVPLLMLILLRAAQLKMKPPLEWCLGALKLDDRLSQEGRKAETRCMAGDRAPLSVVAAVARAKTRQRGNVATEEDRPSNAAYFAPLCILVEIPYFWKGGRDLERSREIQKGRPSR